MAGFFSRLGTLFGPRIPPRLHACVRNDAAGAPPVVGEAAAEPKPPAAEPLYPPEVYGFRARSD